MAQDITQKQAAFVARVGALANQVFADGAALSALLNEWSASGYATGAPDVDGQSWVIPDAPVQQAIPSATAAQLNAAIAALTTINGAINSNMGYLVPLKS